MDAMSLFRDALNTFFWDEIDYEKAIAEMRAEVLRRPKYAELIRTALHQILSADQFDGVTLVEWYANRWVEGSPAKAKEWLERLQADLFGATT
jgi:hypothetical protein